MFRSVVPAWSLVALLAVSQVALAQQAAPVPSNQMKTVKEQASYAIGLNIGSDLKSEAAELDVEALVRGLKDSLAGAKPALSEEQIQAAMKVFVGELQAKAAEKAKGAADKNAKEGAAFLAANKTKQGVKTTASGLQYQVLKAGTGASPKATSTVKTHYHGTLIDGTVFDSSVDRGEPAQFPVNRVIPGWTEALQMMKVGDKWRLFLPSELAYGERGAGDDIGPNSVLVFEVELIDIVQ
ncbi:peptidylprolyl isomerase FKBP-type [Pirellula staleyi DSM 6068]|uniref:Peptidyl-prolyl cis-trans isomerase n=1 Tax=Pirellula staleyi (strain ATCC 27377 / DSM 6068 / ICPB 4128) TaxID=530564 RepID=D2R0P7_PIRSD|nr:FKBP-type peptidyl-prolyl cis-trans isomerase [Pirellula staleyi]ADB16645.1 peptidylprolyl isomerase FKBP-type [Pirellula staleyi DSM 6068]